MDRLIDHIIRREAVLRDFRPHIQIGADGNPEIELGGGRTEVMGLCAALMAGVTAMYGAGDPAAYLIGLMTAAAELLDRMEG